MKLVIRGHALPPLQTQLVCPIFGLIDFDASLDVGTYLLVAPNVTSLELFTFHRVECVPLPSAASECKFQRHSI